MSKAEIIWSPEAEADLDDLYTYIAQESIYYAEQMVEAIAARCNGLLAQPYMGKKLSADEERICEVKEGKYRIIYHIMHLPNIEIVRVIHSARIYF